MKVFASKSSKAILKQLCLVVGGGSEIDAAKIYAKVNNKKLIAIPTTGSGASETSHAVVWKKEKINIPTDIPISISPPFKIELTNKARLDSRADILGHLMDYLFVCNDNELVEVGRYMGKLIEIHPTSLTHKKSYPLTLKGISHGEAVRRVIPECLEILIPLPQDNIAE